MQQSEWAGPIGDVWAQEWRRTDHSFTALDPALNAAILAAAPPGSFRAVDIGCGAGATSLALARARPDAHITGIDISPGLIAAARRRGDGVANLDFAIGDAADEAPARGPADLLFSRHGVMFFDDPITAFARLRTGARPGGRLVFSCFRGIAENEWAQALLAATGGDASPPPPGEPGPFAFADPRHVGGILDRAGWRAAGREPVDFAYRAGEGDDPVADAMSFFRRIGPTARMLRAADPAELPALLDRLQAALASRRIGNVIDFSGAAWIWSATA